MLSEKQLAEIKELQDICEEHENFTLKLNWDMLKARKDGIMTDFFSYSEGKLAGFLALYPFGGKIEMCGMVHPAHRQKGIFTSLLREAAEHIGYASEVLLNAPAESHAAKHLFTSLPCTYAFTEHQMKWSRSDIPPVKEGVSLRPAGNGDAGISIELDVLCFSLSREDAELFYEQTAADHGQTSFIIEYNGEPAGKIRVQTEEKESWIYGFAVHPDFQGQGIGRAVLSSIISRESRQERDIFLEVAAENSSALKLYTSCGFIPLESQDYYKLKFK